MLFYIVTGLFLAGGLLWVLMSRWLKRQVAGIVHTKTGKPMPELSFWSETWGLLKISMGLVKDFDPIDEMLKKRKRMGSIFIGWQGNFPQVYISNPEDIKKLLVDDGLFEKQDVFAHNATLARIFGTSVVAVTGDKWQTQREVLDPAFSAPRIQAMMPIFSKCTNRLLDYWEKKIEKSKDGVFPVWSGFSRMTLDALGMAGYSHDFKALLKTEKNDDLQHYKTIIQALFKPLLLFVPAYINVPTPFNVKLKKAFAGMDNLLYGVVRKHLKALKEGGEKEKKQSKLQDDILGKIITTSESVKCELPEQELRDNMFILFIAGHDTSTSALTSSLYFLSKYPEIQKKAFNQVKQVLNGKTDVTYEDVKKLDYIMSVLRESMRLHPPVDVTTNRVCVKKEGVVLSGYMIPPGTHVLPSITLLHYDDKVWKNASKFDPDRWKDMPYDSINFMGFSAGARTCVGREYAEVEGVVVLALLIQRFEFSLLPGYKMKYRPITVALSPADGLPLKFKKRV